MTKKKNGIIIIIISSLIILLAIWAFIGSKINPQGNVNDLLGVLIGIGLFPIGVILLIVGIVLVLTDKSNVH